MCPLCNVPTAWYLHVSAWSFSAPEQSDLRAHATMLPWRLHTFLWFSHRIFFRITLGREMPFFFCVLSRYYESSTLILYKELSSPIFQSLSVSESVSHPWHLSSSRSLLCAIFKGMRALFWPSSINHQLLPPHCVLYWPSTQLYHLVTQSWTDLI